MAFLAAFSAPRLRVRCSSDAPQPPPPPRARILPWRARGGRRDLDAMDSSLSPESPALSARVQDYRKLTRRLQLRVEELEHQLTMTSAAHADAMGVLGDYEARESRGNAADN